MTSNATPLSELARIGPELAAALSARTGRLWKFRVNEENPRNILLTGPILSSGIVPIPPAPFIWAREENGGRSVRGEFHGGFDLRHNDDRFGEWNQHRRTADLTRTPHSIAGDLAMHLLPDYLAAYEHAAASWAEAIHYDALRDDVALRLLALAPEGTKLRAAYYNSTTPILDGPGFSVEVRSADSIHFLHDCSPEILEGYFRGMR